MVTGVCQKLETLSDGSVKLSIYINREQLKEAVGLSNETVMLTVAKDEQRASRDEVISAVKRAAEAILEAIGQEMNVSISEYPEPEQ